MEAYMYLHTLHPAVTAPSLDILFKKLKIDGDFEDEFREIYGQCVAIAAPKMLYGACEVHRLDDGKTVDVGSMRFQSRVLHINMENISTAYPYVCTCGRELYELSQSQSDPLAQYWVDAISEEYLHQAMTQAVRQVQLDEHTSTLSAMNPGSLPDWPLSQQRPLFALLGNVMGEIGVELTESFLMLPVKSVSGLMFESKEHYTNCTLCPRAKCPNRRSPFDPVLYREKYSLGV